LANASQLAAEYRVQARLHLVGFGKGIALNLKDTAVANLIRIIAAILLPPLGVFLKVGLGGAFWLNILLTLLGFVPGMIHALWVIARQPSPD
jgi:uncharacterized membrane protein YqaE (UPF0057 family)